MTAYAISHPITPSRARDPRGPQRCLDRAVQVPPSDQSGKNTSKDSPDERWEAPMNAHVWRALAWSVAAAIGARVDVQVRLADPAVDGYDGLFISRPGVTVTDDHVELVELGIAVFRDQLGPANEVPPTIWSDLAAGRTSVAAIATPLAQRLASKASTPAPAHTTAAPRGVAAVLTQSALFGLDVDASPAARYVNHRPTLTNPGRHEYRAAFTSAIADIDAAPGPGCLEPLKYWLLTVDIDGAPYDLALIDTGGYVHFPDRSRSERLDLTKLDADLAGWEVLHLPADGGSLADRLAPLIRRHAEPESSVPAFGLPMVLSAFNRKERFFVFLHASGSDDSEALHAPSIGLSPRMRNQLSAAVGSEIPSGAFVATDYHLNWLYAACSGTQAPPPQARLSHTPDGPPRPTRLASSARHTSTAPKKTSTCSSPGSTRTAATSWPSRRRPTARGATPSGARSSTDSPPSKAQQLTSTSASCSLAQTNHANSPRRASRPGRSPTNCPQHRTGPDFLAPVCASKPHGAPRTEHHRPTETAGESPHHRHTDHPQRKGSPMTPSRQPSTRYPSICVPSLGRMICAYELV